MNDQRSFRRYRSDHIFGVADVNSFVLRCHIRDAKRLRVQDLGTTGWHFPVFSTPQDLGQRVAANLAVELDVAAGEHGYVSGLEYEERFDCK